MSIEAGLFFIFLSGPLTINIIAHLCNLILYNIIAHL